MAKEKVEKIEGETDAFILEPGPRCNTAVFAVANQRSQSVLRFKREGKPPPVKRLSRRFSLGEEATALLHDILPGRSCEGPICEIVRAAKRACSGRVDGRSRGLVSLLASIISSFRKPGRGVRWSSDLHV